MPQPLRPVTLMGDHVRLEPLGTHHADGLAAAAAVDRATFGLTWVPDGVTETRAYIDDLLAQYADGLVQPFAQIDVATDAPVGCTRYLDLIWWRGRPEPDEIEIGGTWLGAAAQRTGVNTEAKFLLLRHAFETLGVWRVQICTDVRNERSRRAIERIGATFEGVLRSHRLTAGTDEPAPRDTAVYSVVAREWPRVADGLRERLARR